MKQIIVSLPCRKASCLPLLPTHALSDIKEYFSHIIPTVEQRYALRGKLLDDSTLLSSLFSNNDSTLFLTCSLRLLGGKGGFGSQLKAKGGKMSRMKTTNFDSCRDLSGRRVKIIREATELASFLAKEPERLKEKEDAKKLKERKQASSAQKTHFDEAEFNEVHEEQMEKTEAILAQALLRNRPKDIPVVKSAKIKVWGQSDSESDSEPESQIEPVKKRAKID